jgi:hypothetical protein
MKLNSVKADLKGLENLIKKLNSKVWVDVGILKNVKYPNGQDLVTVAATHEWGSINGNIPERSWLRQPLETKQKEIEKELKPKLQAYLNKQDVKGFMTLIGIACEGQIQAAFDTGGFGTWQAIEPETQLGKKGSTAILIDSSLFRKAITSKVGGG